MESRSLPSPLQQAFKCPLHRGNFILQAFPLVTFSRLPGDFFPFLLTDLTSERSDLLMNRIKEEASRHKRTQAVISPKSEAAVVDPVQAAGLRVPANGLLPFQTELQSHWKRRCQLFLSADIPTRWGGARSQPHVWYPASPICPATKCSHPGALSFSSSAPRLAAGSGRNLNTGEHGSVPSLCSQSSGKGTPTNSRRTGLLKEGERQKKTKGNLQLVISGQPVKAST